MSENGHPRPGTSTGSLSKNQADWAHLWYICLVFYVLVRFKFVALAGFGAIGEKSSKLLITIFLYLLI